MKENNFSVYYVSILFVVYGVLAQVVLRWQRTPGQFWPIRKTQATDLQTSKPDICWSPGVWNIVGPILHPAQLTFYTNACILASFHPAQSWFSPAATRPPKFHINFTMATMRLLNALNVKCKWLEVSLADPPLPIQLRARTGRVSRLRDCSPPWGLPHFLILFWKPCDYYQYATRIKLSYV